MPDKNSNICIIGAGASGLSAAMYLEQKGYDNYTILERSDHVGGKCLSPFHGESEKRFDMGAWLGLPSYYTILDIEKFCGMEHDSQSVQLRYKNDNGDVVNPYNPRDHILEAPRFLKAKKQVDKLIKLLKTKYKGYDLNGHRGVAEGRFDGYLVSKKLDEISGENENLKDLALPFAKFCEINEVPLAQELFRSPFTGKGYGYFDEIPAAYVLKYLDYRTLVHSIKGRVCSWTDGTQSIWETLNGRLKNPARLTCDITRVERSDDKVLVTVNGQVETFDEIIVTAPLQDMAGYFDISEEEKDLFSRIRCVLFDVLALEIAPKRQPKTSYYIPDNMTPDRCGRLVAYHRKWAEDRLQPITAYFQRSHKNDTIPSYAKCKEVVLRDMVRMHNPAYAIADEKEWTFFPHVDADTYASGWYDKVEAMQGENHTWYAGEVMSFSNMEETARYSRELVERFF